METDLQLAQRAVISGAAVALRYFEALDELSHERKVDGSVVTAADRAVETAVREVLSAARPDDAVLGEEQGNGQGGRSGPGNGRRWIVDPIDGTRLFVTGDDRWLVLLGLEVDGEMVVGVAAHPAQGSIWWAELGEGAFEGRIVGGRAVAATRIEVAADGPDTPSGCRLSVVPADWEAELVAPLKAVASTLPWGVHPALMVARGEIDLAIQTGGQIWDFAATSLIVTEAGGSFSGLSGRPRPEPGAALYARSPALREAALETLGGARHAPTT
ncbi:inositol monophosphatase family protein [Actinoplanes sp. KI2]|uniref:inositol monophosphatase family protein n=1 Tax=Actinoplanes sp. KI2 TaxID=2983315 RepID=UPI0021D58371|nr:inositol monophosphatase family protein [Actinoplanes sp. KI2]MCU7722701.1 inositol monophosphatase family protein [Actinoplanes sp. KI2]